MSAHRNAGYGLVGFSFPIGPDGRPLVHPTAHPAIETDFPSYVGGWWRRSRRLFWVAFFASMTACLLVNWVAAQF